MSRLKKKVLYSFCLSTILILSFFSFQTDAAPNSVLECLGEEADCEDDEIPKNELEENENDSDLLTDNNKSSSMAFELVRMFFALLLVLGLIYVLLKFLNKRNKLFNQVKALENLGGISVGQNRSIQIIRIGKRLYLVGVGENVELLQEITDDEVKQDIVRNNQDTQESFPISSLLSPFVSSKKDQTNQSSSSEFKKLFSNELNNLKQSRKNMINKHKEDTHE
ncbi:flagellar biosynthetic protein FliO [Oceanobacillus sp. FSL W7-1309]|uniref:flagellar biosynthetic protein FliO n=1 Tax=Oceanobacillus sp. FSL W7-1309 TaxID=2954539 RepID=UPI0030FC6F23